jgi:hypothetical protein
MVIIFRTIRNKQGLGEEEMSEKASASSSIHDVFEDTDVGEWSRRFGIAMASFVKGVDFIIVS